MGPRFRPGECVSQTRAIVSFVEMRVITTMKNPNTLIIRRYGFEYTPAGQSTAAVTAQTDFVN